MIVLVPACDEAPSLRSCLDAVCRAAAHAELPTHIVVAVGPSTDGTATIAKNFPGAHVIGIGERRVGLARAAAVMTGLGLLTSTGHRPEQIWLASTDADSTVPPDWLSAQRRLADTPIDLILGTVDLPPDATDHVARTWRERYLMRIRADGHRHVHGANLGVRASTYAAAGGFPPVHAHEDRLLANAVRALPGATVHTSTTITVTTSARHTSRTPDGVATDLRRISDAIEPGPTATSRPLTPA